MLSKVILKYVLGKGLNFNFKSYLICIVCYFLKNVFLWWVKIVKKKLVMGI